MFAFLALAMAAAPPMTADQVAPLLERMLRPEWETLELRATWKGEATVTGKTEMIRDVFVDYTNSKRRTRKLTVERTSAGTNEIVVRFNANEAYRLRVENDYEALVSTPLSGGPAQRFTFAPR